MDHVHPTLLNKMDMKSHDKQMCFELYDLFYDQVVWRAWSYSNKIDTAIVHLKLHLRYLGASQSEYKILDELFQFF